MVQPFLGNQVTSGQQNLSSTIMQRSFSNVFLEEVISCQRIKLCSSSKTAFIPIENGKRELLKISSKNDKDKKKFSELLVCKKKTKILRKVISFNVLVTNNVQKLLKKQSQPQKD